MFGSSKAMRRQLVSSDQAQPATQQHRAPCSDCPFARRALRGWLGALSAEDWLRLAHGEGTSECHVHIGVQCAGLAIYRANVGKLPRTPAALALPANRKLVFSSREEFLRHHASVPPVQGRSSRDCTTKDPSRRPEVGDRLRHQHESHTMIVTAVSGDVVRVAIGTNYGDADRRYRRERTYWIDSLLTQGWRVG